MKNVLDKEHSKRSTAFSKAPETLSELLLSALFFSYPPASLLHPSPPPRKSKHTCAESLPARPGIFAAGPQWRGWALALGAHHPTQRGGGAGVAADEGLWSSLKLQ